MTEWRLIKLDFGRSPAHFGELGIGIEETSERVRSDTLFSALATAYARLIETPSIEDFLNKFPRSDNGSNDIASPFCISSTFIYRELGDQTIYYLPRPTKRPRNYPDDDMEFSKTFKGLKFLPLPIWQRWYQREEFTESDCDQLVAKTKKDEAGFKGKDLDQAGTFDYGKAFKSHKVPKVSIDRTTRATNFYHTGFVQFRWEKNNKSGLYFLLFMPEADPDLETRLKAVLAFLGEEGLGGERSSGAGRFEIAYWGGLPDEWKAVVEAPGNLHSLVSTFWESPLDNALLNNASYELQERGGWITSPFSGRQKRRKSVQMFMEGSVFPGVPQGKLADVTPDRFDDPQRGGHKVYRSGIALSLPIMV